MLGVYIFDDKGNIVCFEKPLSLTVDMSLTVPCDIATVVLPYKEYTDGAEIKIYNETDLIFVGVIDEEISIFNTTGNYKKYVARSKMALLLDNQAYPTELNNITRTYLGNKYLKDFSIDFDKGEEVYTGKITVDNGMTVYDIFAEYCDKVFSSSPRMTSKGKLIFNSNIDSEITLSNLSYTSLTENKKRCEKISKVSLMTNSRFYDYIIENKETKGTSICRERFLDASIGKSVYPENGENLIENSNLNSYEVQVTCPYNLTYCLGYKCKVESIAEKLQVAEIEYSYNSKGEETKLILRRCK